MNFKEKILLTRLSFPALLLLTFLLTTGFSFYNPQKKWKGDTPVLEYKVFLNTDLFTEPEAVARLNVIKAAAGEWFSQGEAKVVFKQGNLYSGTGAPFSYAIMCPAPNVKPADFHFSNLDDPDCTSASCSYLWSCERDNKLTAASVQFNVKEYPYSLNKEAGFVHFKTEVTHNMGHMLGLNHCRPGEKECVDNVAVSAVMHRFTDRQNDALAADDIAGLQALYGKLELPFPKTGRYALSEEEIGAIVGQIAFENITGQNTTAGKESFNSYAASLAKYAEKKEEKNLSDLTDQFFQQALANLHTHTSKQLKLGLKFNVMAIYSLDKWITEAEKSGAAPFGLAEMRQAKNYHIQLRNRSIDLLETQQ